MLVGACTSAQHFESMKTIRVVKYIDQSEELVCDSNQLMIDAQCVCKCGNSKKQSERRKESAYSMTSEARTLQCDSQLQL